MKRKTAEQRRDHLVDPTDADPVLQLRAATVAVDPTTCSRCSAAPTRSRVRITRRGRWYHSDRGDDPLRRTVRQIPAFTFINDAKRRWTGLRLGAGASRLPDVLIRLVENGRLDLGAMVSRHIGLEHINDAFPGDGGGRSHPERDRLARWRPAFDPQGHHDWHDAEYVDDWIAHDVDPPERRLASCRRRDRLAVRARCRGAGSTSVAGSARCRGRSRPIPRRKCRDARLLEADARTRRRAPLAVRRDRITFRTADLRDPAGHRVSAGRSTGRVPSDDSQRARPA